MHFIDQGYCFNAGEWTFTDLALHGVYAHNYVYQNITGWESFEPTLSSVEQMSATDLKAIGSAIPAEWYQHDSKGLSDLIAALHKRRSHVRDLITAFRKDSRNPFSNWILEK